MKIKFQERKLINGETKILPIQVGDGSIIKLFDKTPYPKKENDVVCPHFIELKWANGCNFNCAWCYLNGTFRFRPNGKKPYAKNIEKVKSHLLSFFEQVKKPYVLNSGEISDSLVFEGTEYAITKTIIPLFLQQDKHKLLILTKSVDINDLLKVPSDKIIVSYSINAEEVARRWEKAPSIEKRLKAISILQSAGFEIRLRIDPLVSIENWKDCYGRLIEEMINKYEINPSRITIGSLRGLQTTIQHSLDKSWVVYLKESTNWGKRIDFDSRFKMYSFIIEKLEGEGIRSIAFCKETIKMWNSLGKDYKKIECNCL
ncbi:MAG: hypothetical protein H5T45_00570 [Thermoplasmatales archaeon]|nr:hypothetical protein [Thermoplasmatales archaeon]